MAPRTTLPGPSATLVRRRPSRLHGPFPRGQTNTASHPGNPLTSGLSLDPSPDIASITYGANGWSNNLVVFLDPQGGIRSSIYRGTSWSVQPAWLNRLDKSVAAFSSLATTQAMDMYALSKGEIHRFQTNATNPFAWTWIGVVQA